MRSPFRSCTHLITRLCRRPSPPSAGGVREVVRYMNLETPVVLLGTFFVNLCVISVFATGFYGTGACLGACVP